MGHTADGTILYTDNVGKRPSGIDVYTDWQCIAKKFPFLNLSVVLMNGENITEPAEPVMAFHVKNGTVTIEDPLNTDILKDFPKVSTYDYERIGLEKSLNFNDPWREFGIPKEWIYDWSKLAHKLFDDQWDKQIQSVINERKLNNILK